MRNFDAHRQNISRRNFLNTTLQAGAVLGLSAPGVSPLLGAEPEKSKVRFGFTTYTWGKDWDIPTLIANLTRAKVLAVELRTSGGYAHGVELPISAQKRAEVRKQFEGSPVKLLSIACGEQMDWPEPDKLKTAIENAKGYLKLSHDVGASGVRVFPNTFHPNVPHEKTIEQIAKALSELGAYAAEFGQEVRLEAHGPVGELPTVGSIMDQVNHKSVKVVLNSDARDTKGDGFDANFNRVKKYLGHTLHAHNLNETDFPYQRQIELLVQMHWDGWGLLEVTDKVPDRVAGLIEQRTLWEAMVAKAEKAS